MSMSEYIKHARHFDGWGMGDAALEAMAKDLEAKVATLTPPFDEWMRAAGLGMCKKENERLEAENERLREAMQTDIDNAKASCGKEDAVDGERCKPYLDRGLTCPDCTMHLVSTIRKALEQD